MRRFLTDLAVLTLALPAVVLAGEPGPVTVAPEPATLGLVALGLGAVAFIARKRTRR